MLFIKNTIKKSTGKKGHQQWHALFKCKYCGNIVEKLKSNGLKQKSCGCKKSYGHGMSYTRQNRIWSDMKSRCDNPKNNSYKWYGAKGITYDKKWETFEGFWEDMQVGYKDNLTIDRKDNTKNYCKDNCQWLTKSENSGKDSKGKTQGEEWVQKRTSLLIKVDEKCLDEIYQKIKNGSYLYDLLPEFGVSIESVENASKRYAKPFPPNYLKPRKAHNKLDFKVIEKVDELIKKDSISISKACKKVGVSTTTYYNRKKELNENQANQ